MHTHLKIMMMYLHPVYGSRP